VINPPGSQNAHQEQKNGGDDGRGGRLFVGLVVCGLLFGGIMMGPKLHLSRSGIGPFNFDLAVPTVVVRHTAVAEPARASAPTHLTLWLDYTPWAAHIPIFVAETKGYFRQEGLAVSARYPANLTDPIKLVPAQSNTIGIGYMSDVVTAEGQGIPVESIGALVQHHLNCIMTLKSSGITSPRQLAGKSIGAADTPADSVILDTVFKHAGVAGKVRRVNVNYDYVPALVDHRVDAIEGAYQVWEKIMIQQLGHKVNVIQLQNWGVPDEYELVFLASHSMIKDEPAVLGRFMKALTLGEQFAVAHPAEAESIFLNDNPDDKNPSDESLVRQSWHLLIPFVQPKHGKFGIQSAQRWRSLASWMHQNHLVLKVIPNSSLFTNRFLP